MKRIPAVFIIIFIVILTIIITNSRKNENNTNTPTSYPVSNLSDGDIVKAKFNDIEFDLEVAKSNAKRNQGLMGRTDLDHSKGMLFIFEDLAPRQFWMLNTPSSLDIIFFDENFNVIKFYQNTKPNQITETYPSGDPSMFVVEMKGGWVAQSGMTIGDRLDIVIK